MPAYVTQSQGVLEIETRGRGMHYLNSRLVSWLAQNARGDGLLTLFIQHTSASLLIQENADTDVQADLERFFSRLIPDGDPLFVHNAEGPDDMPAHVRAALTQTHLSIPVASG